MVLSPDFLFALQLKMTCRSVNHSVERRIGEFKEKEVGKAPQLTKQVLYVVCEFVCNEKVKLRWDALNVTFAGKPSLKLFRGSMSFNIKTARHERTLAIYDVASGFSYARLLQREDTHLRSPSC